LSAFGVLDRIAMTDEPSTRDQQRALVLVADQDLPARDLQCKWLEAMNMCAVACDDLQALLEQARSRRVDCAVVSAGLIDSEDCVELISELHRADQRLPVIVTGTRTEVSEIMPLVRAGARDFLAAPVSAAAFVDAVRHQVNRRRSVSLGVGAGPRRAKAEMLSPRERQILDYVARGYSTKQIAAAIGRVEKTIEFHRHNLMRKLGASNAAQLIHIAMTDLQQV
jgi:FixJ family two-component response regulator